VKEKVRQHAKTPKRSKGKRTSTGAVHNVDVHHPRRVPDVSCLGEGKVKGKPCLKRKKLDVGEKHKEQETIKNMNDQRKGDIASRKGSQSRKTTIVANKGN